MSELTRGPGNQDLNRKGVLPKSNGTPTRPPQSEGCVAENYLSVAPFGAGVSSLDVSFLGLTLLQRAGCPRLFSGRPLTGAQEGQPSAGGA
jgi:hypothetical protein